MAVGGWLLASFAAADVAQLEAAHELGSQFLLLAHLPNGNQPFLVLFFLPVALAGWLAGWRGCCGPWVGHSFDLGRKLHESWWGPLMVGQRRGCHLHGPTNLASDISVHFFFFFLFFFSMPQTTRKFHSIRGLCS